jgi:hypothetical protein
VAELGGATSVKTMQIDIDIDICSPAQRVRMSGASGPYIDTILAIAESDPTAGHSVKIG